ncbi:MAG: flavin reductase family protein [Alphaproteobacteria bacterium]|nr:flavin reductase family protein [Alphaproteobacteria bacterium]
MAATSVTSVSLDPLSLLVCVSRGTGIRRAIRRGISFTGNLLERRYAPVPFAFRGAAASTERFGFGKWRASNSGIPWLEDGVTMIDFLVDGEVEYRSHSNTIGLVRDARACGEVPPLIYLNGQYQ